MAAIRPDDYARSRNHLDGAVTRLSPYLSHGFVSLPEVRAAVLRRHALPPQHRLLQELGWREFFHHVWRHEGERIFSSLHPGLLPDEAYAPELPDDIRQGATGVPVIDQAVRTLYATGWLHNHARMWLASYVVHLRKVHWRAGADWLYGHLLDGDLASTHLSWPWVAGTGSHKPYLFNAENVARFAPPAWHSPGSPVDASYDLLDALAHSAHPVPVRGGPGVDEPPLLSQPPADIVLARGTEPPRVGWWVHPWSLGDLPARQSAVCGFAAGFHRRWPWSAARWRFVAERMAALSPRLLWIDGPVPASLNGRRDPHLQGHWSPDAAEEPAHLWPDPGERCRSFSQYWSRVSGKR